MCKVVQKLMIMLFVLVQRFKVKDVLGKCMEYLKIQNIVQILIVIFTWHHLHYVMVMK